MSKAGDFVKLVRDYLSILLFVAALLLFAVGGTLIQTTMEARTYNKLTGADVTWWDALWVDLRVQEGTVGR